MTLPFPSSESERRKSTPPTAPVLVTSTPPATSTQYVPVSIRRTAATLRERRSTQPPGPSQLPGLTNANARAVPGAPVSPFGPTAPGAPDSPLGPGAPASPRWPLKRATVAGATLGGVTAALRRSEEEMAEERTCADPTLFFGSTPA